LAEEAIKAAIADYKTNKAWLRKIKFLNQVIKL
jgi:hypothetical protein